jgi:hypothetical protein
MADDVGKGRAKELSPAARGIETLARAVAALGGGYLVAALTAAFLPRVLPMPRGDATVAATLASYLVYLAFAVWTFTAQSALWVWLCLVVICAVLGTALYVSS